MKEQTLNDGFLDYEINKIVKKIRKQYQNEYKIINDFNKYIYILIEKLLYKGSSQQNLFVIASIVEMHKFYQSSIILLERGLPECANSLIRTMIDLLIKIIEVIRNKESVEKLLLNADYELLNILEYIDNHKIFTIIPHPELVKIIEQKNKEIKNRKNPRIKTKDLAEKNNVMDVYMLFRLQSDYTHLSTNIIGRIIDFNGTRYDINEDLMLNNFKIDVSLSLSIVCKMIEFVINEYERNLELQENYKELSNKFELGFKDLI